MIFVVLPLVAAFIGFLTNWVAVRMIYGPREFVGIGPLGWQGLVFRLADKFAAETASSLGQVVTSRDIVARVDIGAIISTHRTQLVDAGRDLAADVVHDIAPGWWAEASELEQAAVIDATLDAVQDAAAEGHELLLDRADDLVALEPLVIEMLSGPEADRLARVSKEIGERELRFIIWYGAVFGFAVGILQAAAYTVLGQGWLLPIVGAIVGGGTNFLAIQMIFRPLEPAKIGPLTVQGMFPKRQREIAADFARIVAEEILTPAHLLRVATTSPAATELLPTVLRKTHARLCDLTELVGAHAGVADIDTDAHAMSALMTVQQRLPELQPLLVPWVEEAVALETFVADQMSSLSKVDFERLFRGVFEEDEIQLVFIGAGLGALVGFIQLGVLSIL